jgi:hypothetical protein
MLSLILGVSPAKADDVTIPGFAVLSYSKIIKLKAKGCQEMKFEYTTEENLPRENTVFLVQLVHKTKKIVYGGTAWFSTFTYMGEDSLPAMPRIGTLKMKLCRNGWIAGSGPNQQKYPAVNPGKYRLYFVGGFVDPETGGPIGDKIEIFKSLKLI